MGFEPIDKDPNAILDYGWDWSVWLPSGDVLVASTWVADSGLTVTLSAFDGGTAVVWLSGGTVGKTYKVVNHIITSEGRQDDRTILIKVVQK